MNNLKKRFDNYVGDAPRFTVSLEDKIMKEVSTLNKRSNGNKFYHKLSVIFLSAVLISVATVFIMSVVINSDSLNQTPSGDTADGGVIKDDDTKEEIDYVEESNDTFLITYGGQNMDRGNYDFVTDHPVVIEKTKEIQRGDIIYFDYPEDDGLPTYNADDYLARVVGLPGETIEIKDGQVYINNKKLETFYGESRRLGINKEEWFKNDPSSSSLTEEDFEVNMEATIVPETAVFVLSDDWIRGTSSINFGPIEISEIKGKVLGYLKEN